MCGGQAEKSLALVHSKLVEAWRNQYLSTGFLFRYNWETYFLLLNGFHINCLVKLFGLGGVACLAQEVSGRLRELGMDDTVVTMHTKELNI